MYNSSSYTGVRDGLHLGRSVRRTAGGAYGVTTRTACYIQIMHLTRMTC